MNERTTLEVIAPTVEEAIQQGLAQLGLTADAVSVEVLDSGSKGLFGLGGRQVRVLLTVNPPVMEKPASPPEPKTAPAKKSGIQAESEGNQTPLREKTCGAETNFTKACGAEIRRTATRSQEDRAHGT